MPKVKRYKYKNIAAALAILLLIILGISTSCSSKADSPKKISDSSSNSSTVKADSSSKKAVKKLTGNYMYVTAKNKTDMVTAIATKFVAWEVPTLDALKNSKVYILREKLNNGGQMNREEKDWLTENVNSNTYFKSAVPLQGWRFDFSDILRTYIVKQYGHWAEYKATDKTSLRNFLYGRIDSIVELNK